MLDVNFKHIFFYIISFNYENNIKKLTSYEFSDILRQTMTLSTLDSPLTIP